MPRSSRRLHIAIVSRLKALLSLFENFSRSTLTNAGATSAKWRQVVTGWGVSGGKGTSSAIGALISTVFASADAVIKTKNAKPGVGPAFWVTDAGNWWAVTYNVTNICQTCSACGAYNSCSYCSSTAYGYDSSCGCASYSQTTCCNSYGDCTACASPFTYTCCTSYNVYSCCTNSVPYSYTCCTQGYYTYTCCTAPYSFTGSCCAAYGYTYKGGPNSCISYYSCTINSCAAYGDCTACAGYGTCTMYTCLSWGACYTCATYGTCNGCNSYYTYTCCTGYISCTRCSGYYQCTYCTGYSYGANASCGCGSYYTYSCNCADNHKIDLVKKENGTETVVASTTNSTTAISGIKVTTSGNNVTAQAYSDTSFTNQVGSNINGTNTGQKSKEHGIISRASNNNQGYTIDEIQVN